ncbi:hypothetical protein D3C87_1843060 [compost metagenome]
MKFTTPFCNGFLQDFLCGGRRSQLSTQPQDLGTQELKRLGGTDWFTLHTQLDMGRPASFADAGQAERAHVRPPAFHADHGRCDA